MNGSTELAEVLGPTGSFGRDALRRVLARNLMRAPPVLVPLYLCFLRYLLFKFPLLASVESRLTHPATSQSFLLRPRGHAFTQGSEEKKFNRRQQRKQRWDPKR